MKFLLAILFLFPTMAFADFQWPQDCIRGFDPTVPTNCSLNQLNNGEPADAEEVMENFYTLGDAIDAATPPLNCSINQIIRWNGTAWKCTADPFANLSCSAGDTLTYDGSAFTCDTVATECIPPGTAITDGNFHIAILDWLENGSVSQYGDITQWCTGAVTDMRSAFGDRNDFNADIGAWDTSNVTDMSVMFSAAHAFNHDVGDWNTNNVTDMSEMFFGTRAFNQDIGAWDTSNVTDMSVMFRNAAVFNQNLSNWDASSVQVCVYFATNATAWLSAYGGSIAGKTPPLSASMIAAGCGKY